MGFFSSITKPFKSIGHGLSSGFKSLTKALGKGVKDVLKMGKSAVKNSFGDLLHPDRLVKNTLRNPLGQITRMIGADIFFPDGPSAGQQKQLAQYSSGDGDTASPQERARMLSRQGMQGTNPIMLLGQDFQDTALDHEEKLGGKDV